MLDIDKKDIDFLKKHLKNINIEELIKRNSRSQLLLELDAIITYKGFNEDYEYNAFGEEAQDVYDRIYDADIINS